MGVDHGKPGNAVQRPPEEPPSAWAPGAGTGHPLQAAAPGHGPNAVLPGNISPAMPPPPYFHEPSSEEVHELLEVEGLPVQLAQGRGRGFVPKKICLRRGSVYVLEDESAVPSIFFGMTGFDLGELRRIVHSAVRAPHDMPLIALEFHGGYLLLQLGAATILRGLIG